MIISFSIKILITSLFIMVRWSVLVCGLFLVLEAGCKRLKDYDRYTLVNLIPHNDEQIHLANSINDSDLEVLKKSRGLNDTVDLLVSPNSLDYARTYAIEHNIGFEIKQNHYGRSIPETSPPESEEGRNRTSRAPRRRSQQSFNIFGYNSYDSMLTYLETVSKRYSKVLQVEDLGTSYQGRPLKLVKISTDPDAGNPVIFIDAGIHAREWVAPVMAFYIIQRLINNHDLNRKELNGVDWYIMPMVNPDGYEYTRSSKAHRLWRKTRSQNVLSCFGVDGNRNYGFKWAVSGVSHNPCDGETYAGPKPFSEPETRAVRSVMVKNAKHIKLYVSLHSYGNYLVYPWGYTGDFLPKEWKKLDTMARAVSSAVQAAGGQPFKVLSAGKWYPAAGGSDDFAFGAVGVPYSYTMELTEGFEFTYPEQLLKPILPQFYEGFKVFAQRIKDEFADA